MPFGFVCQRTGGIAFLGESGVDPDLQRRSYTDNLLTSLFLLLSFTSVICNGVENYRFVKAAHTYSASCNLGRGIDENLNYENGKEYGRQEPYIVGIHAGSLLGRVSSFAMSDVMHHQQWYEVLNAYFGYLWRNIIASIPGP